MNAPVEQLRERISNLADEWEGVWAEVQAILLGDGGSLPEDLRLRRRELAEEIVRELNRLEPVEPEAIREFAKLRVSAQDQIDLDAGGIDRVRVTQQPRRKLTDLGNAERFADDHADDLKYSPGVGWMHWDGCRYQNDRSGERSRRAKRTARSIFEEARVLDDKDLRKAVSSWAIRSEHRARLEAMVKLGESDESIVVLPEFLDADPDLLTVLNATVELTTGETRPHSRADLATKLAPVEFDPDAKCPIWMACVETWLAGKIEPDYLQRAVGYSLTGHTSEQCMFVLDGEGANGKTTFLETIGALTGDYGTTAEAATFMAARAGTVRSDVARLHGKRFVRAAEVEDNARIAEVLVKQLTGGDTMVARYLYQSEFEFRPALKLWIAANKLPTIHGTDHAIWRRIRRIPFPTKIVKPDRDLPEKLREELPGILNWAIEGCLTWRRDGLGVPPSVKEAMQDYRHQEDTVGQFLRECCVKVEVGGIAPMTLRNAYRAWCHNENREPVGGVAFTASLASHGLSQKRDAKTRLWTGIELRR